jgi:hypothetical protein
LRATPRICLGPVTSASGACACVPGDSVQSRAGKICQRPQAAPWLRSAALLLAAAWLSAGMLQLPRPARADAGPPFLTNDPDTPGDGNWEINIGYVSTLTHLVDTHQLPQLDLNFGVGDRIQLTYEIPYVLQMRDGARESGWSNALPGVKWRFFDQGENGWQLSTFPQLETAGSPSARRTGIAVDGPRLLLPLEIARAVGPLRLDFEAGYYAPWHGPEERILGFVVGVEATPRLELDAELYNDHAMGASPQVTTIDFGGRLRLHRAFILLFMAGRSLSAGRDGQVDFMGYLGIQVLLSHYGLRLGGEP